MSNRRLRPGVLHGPYPQKHSDFTGLELTFYRVYQLVIGWLFRLFYSQRYVVAQINRYRRAIEQCDEQQLTESIEALRADLHKEGLTKRLIFKSFAIIRETSKRTLGKPHFDVQLFGAWIMVNGKLAEMHTGEGKTLTTALAACTAALAGIPVHVITANDYLASRDATTIQPLYKRLGLQASFVIETMDIDQRRESYKANIVHTTNKQIAFDYLRDRINMADDMGRLRQQLRQIKGQVREQSSPPLLRGLCFALVDEADSVLIDEAKTPLIITKTIPSHTSEEMYARALYLASTLLVNYDYTVDYTHKLIEITANGEQSLAELVVPLPPFWHNRTHCHRLVKQALVAQLFYKKDQQYVVSEDKIQIVDESTGRIMGDRSWEQGLHQMIEVKEGCPISDAREVLARISYQRFFSYYFYLGGASGTIRDVATELQRVYGLDVIPVATHRRCKRIMLGDRLFKDNHAKQQALVARVKTLHQQGRPILIGTTSVEESEQVSQWLTQTNITHRVLNAKQDEQEADIIAQAGQHRAVTVATNMAGRGTDILLDAGVRELGGLHVISLNRNDSRRIDKQLYGRSARQGDPGSAETMLALDDQIMINYYSPTMLSFIGKLFPNSGHLPTWLSGRLTRLPQRKQEIKQARTRAIVMQWDRRLRRTLAFAGRFD